MCVCVCVWPENGYKVELIVRYVHVNFIITIIQDDQPAGLGGFVTLPELKSRLSEEGDTAYVDHRDLISQALMERIMLFTEDSMDTTVSDGPAKQQLLESMEDDKGDTLLNMDGYLMPQDGGSGPPSLGSLTLSSQPTSLGQQSLSVGSGESV